eukprot:CAMPEP_0197658878 /NCGR_PEP_ID=MMETSP1338-20131121/45503_1 /TAXON_ID=43686 ORGANISM="Pelagodinium beii, Strain RCC1491" /NCGR_SAMPLE_ID=MMETSP1338 /ASSEMBLY_ACC=CAM_ASM_000754 /LENGTH=197 /DNA_ID=CAMNT_0043235555 /DNA_START=114 /DNA_END=707 /DNA_ORIENTATION=-
MLGSQDTESRPPSSASLRLKAECLQPPATALLVLEKLHGHDIPEGLEPGNCEVRAQEVTVRSDAKVDTPHTKDDTPILRVADSNVIGEARTPRHFVAELAAVVNSNGPDGIERRRIQKLTNANETKARTKQRRLCQGNSPPQPQVVTNNSKLEDFDPYTQVLCHLPVDLLVVICKWLQDSLVADSLEGLWKMIDVAI